MLKKRIFLQSRIFICLLSSFFSISSWAQWEWDQNAELSYFKQFFTTSLEDNNIKDSYSILELKPAFQIKAPAKINFSFEAYFFHKFEAYGESEKNFFDLSQGYVESKVGPWRFRAGNQIYNWGILDIYSPGDVINSTTLFDPLNIKKLGATSLDITWSTFGKKIQFVYLPIRRSFVFPEENSRWLPRSIITNSSGLDTNIYLPEQIEYNYQKDVELTKALKDNFGTRLSFTFGEVDWHIFYFQGLTTRPQMDVEVTVIADVIDPNTGKLLGVRVEPEVSLTPIYYPQRTVGNSLVWAPEWGILRWETTYTEDLSEDIRINEELLQSAIGAEKPFNIGSKTLLAQLQYYITEQKNELNNLSGSNFQIFNDSMILNAILNINDKKSVFTSHLYNFNNQASLGVLGGTLKFSDNMKLETKYLWLNGPEDSILGTYKNNDLIELKLSLVY